MTANNKVAVFNLERAIAPLTPFKGNWRKYCLLGPKRRVTNPMRFENMQQFSAKKRKNRNETSW